MECCGGTEKRERKECVLIISMDELDLGQTIRGFAAGDKMFNRYTLKAVLGRGGMGIVWRAFDEELERDVALKFLPELLVLDKAAMDELKRETKRSLELTHHHIVRIYDFAQDNRSACISMEYVDGQTLSALRVEKENKVFEVDELAPLVEQACDALEYAHVKAKIVHRDFKPSNLMLNSRGELKVTDFGIARSLSDSVSMISARTSGTLVYMSPQQLDGERANPADDIYSLGATIYELLTSKPPFYSGGIERQIHEKTPSSIAARRSELNIASDKAIPPQWETAIAACLAKDVAMRPQSARDVAQRLGLSVPQYGRATASAAAPTLTKTPVSAATAKPATRKLVVAAAFGALVLIGGGLGWYFGIYAPNKTAQKAEAPKRIFDRTVLAMNEEVAKQQKKVEAAAAEVARIRDEEHVVDLNLEGEISAEELAAGQINVTYARAKNAYIKEKLKLDEVKARAQKQGPEAISRAAEARGAVLINTEPEGATVTLGKETQKSPATFDQAKVGMFLLKVTLENYEPVEQQIEVKEGQVANPGVIKLVRSTGIAQVDSTPQGIDFDLEDAAGTHHTGKTPQALADLPAGPGKITYKPDKAEPHTESVAVAAHGNSVFGWKAPEQQASAAIGATASAKPSATTGARKLFGGRWQGTLHVTSSDGSRSTLDSNLFINENETEVTSAGATNVNSNGYVEKKPAGKQPCHKDGDTLVWERTDRDYQFGKYNKEVRLEITGPNTLRYVGHTRFTSGLTLNTTGTLRRAK